MHKNLWIYSACSLEKSEPLRIPERTSESASNFIMIRWKVSSKQWVKDSWDIDVSLKVICQILLTEWLQRIRVLLHKDRPRENSVWTTGVPLMSSSNESINHCPLDAAHWGQSSHVILSPKLPTITQTGKKNWCPSANNWLDTPIAKLQKAGENCTALGEIKSPSAKARDHSRAWVTSQTLLLLTC